MSSASRRPVRRGPMPALSRHSVTHYRQLDWRFLLPAPNGIRLDSLRLVCEDPAIADWIREVGLARTVVVGAQGSQSVDAVVVLTGRPADLVQAVTTLRPGGVLYGEVDRAGPRALAWSPERLRRRLRRAGVEGMGAYWRRRRGGADVLFVPFDVPGAVQWYLREAMDDRGRRRRMIQRALALVLRGDGRRLGTVARRYAVTGVADRPGPATSASATPAVLVSTDVTALRPVLLARGEAPWSRVALLPFGAADDRPRCVVKVPRRPQHNPATLREQRTLAAVHERLTPALAVTVPVAISLRQWSGLCVATESFLPGRPLAFAGAPVAGRLSTPAQLHGAVDWLIDIHRTTRSGEVAANDPSAADLIDGPLHRLAQLIGLQASWVDRLVERFGFDPAADPLIPIVWQHCDLTPRNMRWDGRHHAVVDWEVARVGPALCDLLYLLLQWNWLGEPSFGKAHAAVFRRVYMSREGYPAAEAARQVTRYCAALTMDRRLVEPLLLGMLTQQALDRAHRVRDCGADPAHDDNVYADLIHVMASGSPRLTWWGAW